MSTGAVFFQWQADGDGGGTQEVIWQDPFVTTDEFVLPSGATRTI